MAEILNIAGSRRKRLDVSSFFGEGAFIIIKKINRLISNEISLLSQNTAIMKMAFSMVGDNELTPEEKKIKVIEYYSTLTEEERLKSAESSIKIEKLYIDNGVEPSSHNITFNSQPIELNYDFLVEYPEVIEYLLEEIKIFQEEGYKLGELNTNK